MIMTRFIPIRRKSARDSSSKRLPSPPPDKQDQPPDDRCGRGVHRDRITQPQRSSSHQSPPGSVPGSAREIEQRLLCRRPRRSRDLRPAPIARSPHRNPRSRTLSSQFGRACWPKLSTFRRQFEGLVRGARTKTIAELCSAAGRLTRRFQAHHACPLPHVITVGCSVRPSLNRRKDQRHGDKRVFQQQRGKCLAISCTENSLCLLAKENEGRCQTRSCPKRRITFDQKAGRQSIVK